MKYAHGMLMRTSPDGAWFGVKDKEWVVETGRGVFSLEQPKAFQALLPLLEHSYPEFVEDLKRVLSEHQLPHELLDSFPSRALVDYALRTGSAYWKELALDWLESMSEPGEFLDLLSEICDSRGWPQSLRHRARKLRARIQR